MPVARSHTVQQRVQLHPEPYPASIRHSVTDNRTSYQCSTCETVIDPRTRGSVVGHLKQSCGPRKTIYQCRGLTLHTESGKKIIHCIFNTEYLNELDEHMDTHEWDNISEEGQEMFPRYTICKMHNVREDSATMLGIRICGYAGKRNLVHRHMCQAHPDSYTPAGLSSELIRQRNTIKRGVRIAGNLQNTRVNAVQYLAAPPLVEPPFAGSSQAQSDETPLPSNPPRETVPTPVPLADAHTVPPVNIGPGPDLVLDTIPQHDVGSEHNPHSLLRTSLNLSNPSLSDPWNDVITTFNYGSLSGAPSNSNSEHTLWDFSTSGTSQSLSTSDNNASFTWNYPIFNFQTSHASSSSMHTAPPLVPNLQIVSSNFSAPPANSQQRLSPVTGVHLPSLTAPSPSPEQPFPHEHEHDEHEHDEHEREPTPTSPPTLTGVNFENQWYPSFRDSRNTDLPPLQLSFNGATSSNAYSQPTFPSDTFGVEADFPMLHTYPGGEEPPALSSPLYASISEVDNPDHDGSEDDESAYSGESTDDDNNSTPKNSL